MLPFTGAIGWRANRMIYAQFEKVLVVGLKERSDRRDVLAVQSTLTGFNVDWVDGVMGEDVPSKALPPVSSFVQESALSTHGG